MDRRDWDLLDLWERDDLWRERDDRLWRLDLWRERDDRLWRLDLRRRDDLWRWERDWNPLFDKSFARQFWAQLGLAQTAPFQPRTPLLCDQCRQIQLPFNDTSLSFNTTSQNCQLCAMILQLFRSSIHSDGSVVFHRRGSNLDLRVEDRSKPGLVIVAIPGVGAIPQDIQIGFPVLPEVGGSIHFSLLREWLRVCDECGKCYKNHSQPRLLPTRVLDVGDQKNQKLLLHDTFNQEKGRYIALSHRWGNPTEAEKAEFCTYACNIAERRTGINFKNLPRTFQDAVTVARELGVRYLWIDSMCIKQAHQGCKCGDCGPESGDWKTEAEKMEQYFGSAYCTVAADSAEGLEDGLLQPRQARQCVQVPNQGGTAVYLCKAIDDFDRDVDKGVLNQRGWVFQERALSCRTIHYTNTQTYWECGCKIRCETLGALEPPLRYRLNEPQFPRSNPLTGYPGREIFKFIFQQYSPLSLTKASDRSTAISGVVKRLVKCLNSRETYGIFEKYLHQSLLWRRTSEGKMHRIAETQTTMPSWSWMAYEGGIEYIDIKNHFRGSQISLPSAEDSQSSTGLYMELREPAGRLNWEDVNEDGEKLTFDGENPDKDNKTCTQELKFAIVGRERRDDTRVYVLIIKPYSTESAYERVGVGYVLERHMSDVRGVMVWVT